MRTIERRLPLLVSALLLAAGLALLVVGYGEVRSAARQIADARLRLADSAIATLLRGDQQRTRLTTLARSPILAAFLSGEARRTRSHDSLLVLMHQLVPDTASATRLEIRDTVGPPRLHTGRFDAPAPALSVLAGDSVVIGPLVQRDTFLYYSAAAAIRRGDRQLGVVQQVARLTLSERTRKALTGLAGGEIVFLLGNTAGDPWTDFERILPAPPVSVRSSLTPVPYERGESKRAAARPVPGTAWTVIAELPSRTVTAPARAYFLVMAPIALLLILIGAWVAWWGSRRLTRPLREIANTAQAIAAGDRSRRVPIRGRDELASLGRSFNTMADQLLRALQSTETMLRSVTETAHDAIIAADADGLIRFWNPGAQRIFGYGPEEVLGKPITMLMPQRFHDAHRAGIRRYVETGEPHVVGTTVELTGRRKTGAEFPLELSLGAAPLDGVESFTGIIRDITERKRIQEALQRTNAELESFSYSVSHDLRAPLRAIHGFARILLEDHQAQLDPEARRLLGVIDQNTRRMGDLIDDLLAFSRLGRQELTTARVDMRELARGVADEMRSVEPERKLEIQIDPLPIAQGDRALLRQVFSNLLQNAAKFTRGKEPSHIEVGSRPDGNQNVYFVKDNGAGFDARYSDKLFGVFQRLHHADEFEGTGVGLAIVKRIVQRHGGKVWAEGKVGEGATFFFTLPNAEE